MWREPRRLWPHKVAFREGRCGAWWEAVNAGVEKGVNGSSGGTRPREAGIECTGNGCGGLRMCDRDRSGAGLGLGV